MYIYVAYKFRWKIHFKLFAERALSDEEVAPEFVSLFSKYPVVDATTQGKSDVSLKSFTGRYVIFVADVRQDLFLRKAIGWLFGAKQIVNENRSAYHFLI